MDQFAKDSQSENKLNQKSLKLLQNNIEKLHKLANALLKKDAVYADIH